MDLAKARQEVIDRHKLLESVPESPVSPQHQDMKKVLEPIENGGLGQKMYSDRPVALQVNDEVFLVGPCLVKVQEALKKFVAKVKAKPKIDIVGNGPKYQDQVVRIAERVLAAKDQVCISTQHWNYCNEALTVENILVVHRGVSDDE